MCRHHLGSFCNNPGSRCLRNGNWSERVPTTVPMAWVQLGLCDVATHKDTLVLPWCSLARYTAQQASPCLPPSFLVLFLLIHRTRESDATVTLSNDRSGFQFQISQRQSSSQISGESTSLVTLKPPEALSNPQNFGPGPGNLQTP